MILLFNQLKVQTWLQQATSACTCTCIDKLSSKNKINIIKKINEKFIKNQ